MERAIFVVLANNDKPKSRLKLTLETRFEKIDMGKLQRDISRKDTCALPCEFLIS